MLSRLMKDQGDLVKTQLQYKTTLKYIMRPKRSTLTMRQFVKELRQTWTSKFQDYHILLWNNCIVPAFENWFRKLRTTPNRHALERDLRQNQSINPFSTESKQMIHEVGNIELCELLDMEPKAQCKVCLSYWDVGIVYCTCGHFLRKRREENQKFIEYTMDLPFHSRLRHKERTTSRTPIRQEAGRQGIPHRQPAEEEEQEEVLPGVSMTDLYEMNNSAVEW